MKKQTVRKLICLLALAMCLPLLFGCGAPGSEGGDASSAAPGPTSEAIGETADYEIKMILLDWSGYGVGTKLLDKSPLTDAIESEIEKAENALGGRDKVYGRIPNEYIRDIPAEKGTLWLEIGKYVYRVTPDISEIFIVRDLSDKGNELEMSHELKQLITNAWFYYPYDYYTGVFDGADGSLLIEHPYIAGSAVSLNDVRVELGGEGEETNKVVLELLAAKDITVDLYVESYQSSDYFGSGETKTVTLEADVPQTVEMSFLGFNIYYYVRISADNTVVELKILP
ncbi:MAG: hypothetical protein K6G89_02415 [Clostridia bacterium]|nr:hypothetical protein [Clostridia bacterium]